MRSTISRPRGHSSRATAFAAAVLFGAALFGSNASAQPSSDQSASILFFPHVVADGRRDTVVQLANTSNSSVTAWCFYLDAALAIPDEPPGLENPRVFQVIDFLVILYRQQPTHWVVSRGRRVDPTDARCSPTNPDCDGAGFDSLVPSVPERFIGELLCIEVDPSGSPVSGNHLAGRATLTDSATGDIAVYNAIGARGGENNDGNASLVLGPGSSGEYDACPVAWILNHAAPGSEDSVLGPGSAVETIVTLVPCSQDFAAINPAGANVNFLVRNEFELAFSTSLFIAGWDTLALGATDPIFTAAVTGSGALRTMITTGQGDPGLVVVAEQAHRGAGELAVETRAALNLHVSSATISGHRPAADVIRLPELQ